MSKAREPKIGRPRRSPGHTYTIEDIPTKDFLRFKRRCERVHLSMRDVLIAMIRNSGVLDTPILQGKGGDTR